MSTTNTTSTVPDTSPSTTATRSRSSASASSRSSRRRPPRRSAAPSRSATGTSTPPRCTATRAGSARRSAPPAWTEPRSSSPASSTTASTGPTTRAGRSSGRCSELGFDYVDLFLIHWPLPTLYDGDFVSTWKTMEEFQADGRARSIGVSNFQVAHLGAPGRRSRPGAGGQPDRAAPLPAQRAGARLRRGARHRHRGVVADRAGRRARRPGDHRDRREARQVTGPGGAALAHPARQHRLPQVDDPGADQGELRASSTSSSRRRRWRRSPRSTRARRAGPARTPTRSTTSPTDRGDAAPRPNLGPRCHDHGISRLRRRRGLRARASPPRAGGARRAPDRQAAGRAGAAGSSTTRCPTSSRVAEHDVGLQSIALASIVGTVNRRGGDFDRAFRPRTRRLERRWQRIAAARRRGEPCPRSTSTASAGCTSSSTATIAFRSPERRGTRRSRRACDTCRCRSANDPAQHESAGVVTQPTDVGSAPGWAPNGDSVSQRVSSCAGNGGLNR